MLEVLVVLYQFGQPVAVHLGHLNIRNDQRHLVIQVWVAPQAAEELPQLTSIREHVGVHVAGLVEGLLDHLAQQYGVLCHQDDGVAPLAFAQALDLGHLDGGFRRDLRHNLLEVQDGHQVIPALGDARGDALVPSGHGFVRLLDALPGDAADAHHSVHPEGNVHLVEIGDDEQVFALFLPRLPQQVRGQVHHGDHLVPGLENSLHRRVGVGHVLDGLGDKNLLDLRHVDAVQAVIDGEFHDLDFICARLQQNAPLVLFQQHSEHSFQWLSLSHTHTKLGFK